MFEKYFELDKSCRILNNALYRDVNMIALSKSRKKYNLMKNS